MTIYIYKLIDKSDEIIPKLVDTWNNGIFKYSREKMDRSGVLDMYNCGYHFTSEDNTITKFEIPDELLEAVDIDVKKLNPAQIKAMFAALKEKGLLNDKPADKKSAGKESGTKEPDGAAGSRPGLVKKKVTVRRNGKSSEEYRWVKAGEDEPAEKPKKGEDEPEGKPGEKPEPEKPKGPIIQGLNKPEGEDGDNGDDFASGLNAGDWVNVAGRLVKVKSVDVDNKKVTVGIDGSFIPDETFDFDRMNEIGSKETGGKADEPVDKPKKGKGDQEEKPGVTSKPEKPKAQARDEPDVDDDKEVESKKEFHKDSEINKRISEAYDKINDHDIHIDPELSNARMDMESYTGGGYVGINDYLRDGNLSGREEKALKTEVDNISKLLKNSDLPTTEGQVFRGMTFPKDDTGMSDMNEFMDQFNVGEEVELKGFTSTTMSPDVAAHFHDSGKYNITFNIMSKRGVYLDGLSRLPDEHEVLFDHKAKFKVTGMEFIGDDIKMTMEEVNEKETGNKPKAKTTEKIEINIKEL